MKKTLITLSLLCASTTAIAAQPTNLSMGGGYSGPTVGLIQTVAEALKARDDVPVTITGNIVHSYGDEDYLFSDGSNEIVVEIDDKDWAGITVTDKTKVIINGEVDREWMERTIDVNTVRLAK